MVSYSQINYLSPIMLTLNLLNLFEKSETDGRVILNVYRCGKIFWDEIQTNKNRGYVNGIHQAMAAKRMFLVKEVLFFYWLVILSFYHGLEKSQETNHFLGFMLMVFLMRLSLLFPH